jgi:hypothetical protein
MTGSINTDPDALDKMVRELKYANEAIDGCIKKVRGALNASHWHDNVRTDFEHKLENIASLARQIGKLSEESQQMLSLKLIDLKKYTGR